MSIALLCMFPLKVNMTPFRGIQVICCHSNLFYPEMLNTWLASMPLPLSTLQLSFSPLLLLYLVFRWFFFSSSSWLGYSQGCPSESSLYFSSFTSYSICKQPSCLPFSILPFYMIAYSFSLLVCKTFSLNIFVLAISEDLLVNKDLAQTFFLATELRCSWRNHN